MGVRTLVGDGMACLFDSTTDFAFGPVFFSCEGCGAWPEDQAEDFLTFCTAREVSDLRMVPDSDLVTLYGEWWTLHEASDDRRQQRSVEAV